MIVVFSILLTWGKNISQYGFFKPYFQNTREDYFSYKRLDKIYKLSNQKSILFLSNGLFTYYFNSPSHCKEFFPYTLQHFAGTNYSDSVFFKNEKDCFLSYSGEYILLQPDWFDFNNLEVLRNKIDDEYFLIHKSENSSRCIEIYKKD